MNEFMLGAMATASGVIGLFFLRYWRKTSDGLFLCFALAFWMLGGNWFVLAFVNRDEPQTALYSMRLLAFCLIIAGIWVKNRKASRRQPP